MHDISLHLLDIIENSARAESKNIWIKIFADIPANTIKFIVKDDGFGMSEEMVKAAQDPFFTTKKIRRAGLGIPLFKQSAELCGGSFDIKSKLKEGTEIIAVFTYDSINRMPIGSLKDTILSALLGHSDVDFHLHLHKKSNPDEQEFCFSTAEIKAELDGIPITYPDVIQYIQEVLDNGIREAGMEEF